MVNRLILIIRKIIWGGKKRCSHFFSNLWAYAYLKEKGANVPPMNEIHFYGWTDMNVEKGVKITIGRGFICRSGFNNAIDNSCGSRIVVRHGASLTIGEYSGMSNTIIHCHDSVVIGNHVNIGAGTMIFDTNFHSTDWRNRANRTTDCCNAKTAPVTIGDYVFIGARTTICKGVTIGEKSMVAVGSVVVKDIPAGEMWGGNPARLIKRL